MVQTHVAGGLLVALAVLALAACEPVSDVLGGGGETPHQAYAESLRDAGLADRALGAAWLAAADRALEAPLPVTLPFRETGFFAGDAADARGYRVAARRGERLEILIESESEGPAALFLDLFEAETDDEAGPEASQTWEHVASGDSIATVIRHEVDTDGIYVVRLQPELLRPVRYVMTIQVGPTLAFPVQGHDAGAIRSGFGADRDGGQRVHHGVDIFAPRGTPVLAAAEGRAEPRLNRLGGKVVWQRVPGLGSIYYAHLDSQAVAPGAVVRRGDTLGYVGNTGNAVTTPPHLHFGIYARPGGPVDPFPFLYEPEAEPPPPLGSDEPLAHWARTTGPRRILRAGPSDGAAATDSVPAGTVGRVVAGAGAWRRIVLPGGRTGFVPADALVPAAEPLRRERIPASTVLRTRPDSSALAITTLPPDAEVAVLGTFRDWLLVTVETTADAGTRGGTRGWIRAG